MHTSVHLSTAHATRVSFISSRDAPRTHFPDITPSVWQPGLLRMVADASHPCRGHPPPHTRFCCCCCCCCCCCFHSGKILRKNKTNKMLVIYFVYTHILRNTYALRLYPLRRLLRAGVLPTLFGKQFARIGEFIIFLGLAKCGSFLANRFCLENITPSPRKKTSFRQVCGTLAEKNKKIVELARVENKSL